VTEYDLAEVGDRRRDREGDDEVIVIDVWPTAAADGWHIDAIGATVADVNPEYDGGAPVVRAVYADDVAVKVDGWRSADDLEDAVEAGALRSYDFPLDRLAPVDEEVTA
jgi:hypothetical protein